MLKLISSLGVDIKLIDGVPNWSPRGADSFSPFSSRDYYNAKVTDASKGSQVTIEKTFTKPCSVIIFLYGHYYNNSGYLLINDIEETIYTNTSIGDVDFYRIIDVQAGDTVKLTFSSGLETFNYRIIGAIVYNNDSTI